MSDEKSWRAFAEKLEKEGFAPDMLINNAGYLLPFGKAEKHSVKEAENILSTNYLSCVYSFHSFLPLLKKSASPAVVNVSSSAALAPVAGTALYSASKAALKSFTECLAMDYKGEIYIAGVYPGFTKTAIFSHQKRSADSKLIDAVTMPVDKAVKRILKKLKRKKTYIVTGRGRESHELFLPPVPPSDRKRHPRRFEKEQYGYIQGRFLKWRSISKSSATTPHGRKNSIGRRG